MTNLHLTVGVELVFLSAANKGERTCATPKGVSRLPRVSNHRRFAIQPTLIMPVGAE